jgi:hypothetical protein
VGKISKLENIKMKNHNTLKVLAVLVSLLLISSSIAIFVPSVKADTTYPIVFSVSPSGSGTISWIDTTMPYHDGSTTTSSRIVFPSGDVLQITSTPNSGNIVHTGEIFTYVSGGSSGYININPLTATPVSSAFNLTANFLLPINPQVTIIPDYGSTVTYTDETAPYHDGSTNVTTTVSFPINDQVEFQATVPNSSVIFQYFILTGAQTGSTNNNPTNPVTVTGDFTVEAVCLFQVNPHVTVINSDSSQGLVWSDLTAPYHDGATGATVTVTFPTYDNVSFYAIPKNGWQFSNWVISGIGNTSANPYVVPITSDFTIEAYFIPSTFYITIAGVQATNAYSFTLESGHNYTVTAYLTVQSLPSTSGNYEVMSTELSTDYNVAFDGLTNYTEIIAPTGYTEGIFSFILSIPSRPNTLYQGLELNAIYNTTSIYYTYPVAPFSGYLETFLNDLIYQRSYLNLVQNINPGLGGMIANIKTNYKTEIYLGPTYSITWLGTNTSPTTNPNNPLVSFGFLSFLWGTTAKLLYSVIILAVLSFLFLWKGGVWGLFIGLAIGEIVDILFLGFPSWTLYPLVGAEIVIVATALLGERGGASK